MLLAIDTATRRMGLALYDGIEVHHESVWTSSNRHTVVLTQAIQHALTDIDLTPDDLGAVAVALGPGSYTGLRIGAAAAKGLALAQHIPLIAIPTFEIIAASQPVDSDRRLAAVLEAGRKRLGVGWFKAKDDAWVIDGEPELLTPEELNDKIRKPTLVCGELNETVRAALARKRKNALLATPAQSLRRPSFLAELAWKRWQAGDVDDVASIAPQYLQTDQNLPQ